MFSTARVVPVLRQPSALALAARLAAGPDSRESVARPDQMRYFGTDKSVRIGPYLGRIEYFHDAKNPSAPPVLARARIDTELQLQRSWCRKVFDKLFRRIDTDGYRPISATRLSAFWRIEKAFASAVSCYRQEADAPPAVRPDEPGGARSAIDGMAAQIRVMTRPTQTLETLRKIAQMGDATCWEQVMDLLRVTTIAKAAWREPRIIRGLAALCGNHAQLLQLASTADIKGNSWPALGLGLMAEDVPTARCVARTLAKEIKDMPFDQARALVDPFVASHRRDAGRTKAGVKSGTLVPWETLRDRVKSLDAASMLARDMAACKVESYDRALSFILSHGSGLAGVWGDIIALNVFEPTGARITAQSAAKLARFLTGTEGDGDASTDGAICPRALGLVWSKFALAHAIDNSARAAAAPGGDLAPFLPLLRTHPNKAYVAQFTTRIPPHLD